MRRRKGAAVAVKKLEDGLTLTPAVYIPENYHPEYPAAGPEYPYSPEFPGPRPETPAPPDSEQIWHTLS